MFCVDVCSHWFITFGENLPNNLNIYNFIKVKIIITHMYQSFSVFVIQSLKVRQLMRKKGDFFHLGSREEIFGKYYCGNSLSHFCQGD